MYSSQADIVSARKKFPFQSLPITIRYMSIVKLLVVILFFSSFFFFNETSGNKRNKPKQNTSFCVSKLAALVTSEV